MGKTSDSQLRAIAKHDKENWEHISFKVRKGSILQVREAAEAVGKTVNGFIRDVVSEAIMSAIGIPLEPSPDKAAEIIWHRIISFELEQTLLKEDVRINVEQRICKINPNLPLFQETQSIISSNDPPARKGKKMATNKELITSTIQTVLMFVTEEGEFHDPVG